MQHQNKTIAIFQINHLQHSNHSTATPWEPRCRPQSPMACGLELAAAGLEFASRPRAPPPGPPAAVLACCCPRRARRRGWGLAAARSWAEGDRPGLQLSRARASRRRRGAARGPAGGKRCVAVARSKAWSCAQGRPDRRSMRAQPCGRAAAGAGVRSLGRPVPSISLK